MILAGYIAAILTGIALSFFGGGGAIITLPVLAYFFGVDNPALLTSYSLFIVAVGALFSVAGKWKQRLINYRSFIWFGLPSTTAIILTRKWLVPLIPAQFGMVKAQDLLLLIFAGFMLVAGYAMTRKTTETDHKDTSIFILVVIGIMTGIMSGLLGAGGGFIIVPALVYFGGLHIKEAIGTSLLIIAVNAAIGVGTDISSGFKLDGGLLITYLVCMTGGVFAGHYLTRKIKAEQLKTYFGWFVILTGMAIGIKQLFLIV